MTTYQQKQSEQGSSYVRNSSYAPSTGNPRGPTYFTTQGSDRPTQHQQHVSSAYDYQPQTAMNMGHMSAALPGSSSTAPYGQHQYTANQAQYARQPTGPFSTYQPHIHAQSGVVTPNHSAPQYHSHSPLYGNSGFAPYQMYSQPGTSFFSSSALAMNQHHSASQYKNTMDDTGMVGHPRDSLNSFMPYQVDKPQYPFHVIQAGQGNAMSSSGGNTTYGTSAVATPVDSGVPRGPPRKPKQSGHALWVGNLPPDATVSDLKDHFARGLTEDIESLKLISKSNCAFVNYKSPAACAMAMHRFHESRFHGTRLVCRLRRSSNAGQPTGPFPPSSGIGHTTVDSGYHSHPATPVKIHEGRTPERFFVLKSLTTQDLESSVRSGYWATQPHNEDALNQAFESADNVYLIFSANKSGEYFGYARMASAVTYDVRVESGSQQQQQQQQQQSEKSSPFRPADRVSITNTSSESGTQESGPRAIITPATEWAPRGRIIDDSSRGTIFWEADSIDTSPPPSHLASVKPLVSGERAQVMEDDRAFDTKLGLSSSNETATTTGSEAEQQQQQQHMALSGGSFRVDWLNTHRVPFFTTRGLRNPWNVNREVKIARDGTEIEPGVARKLIALFNNPNIRRMDAPYMY